VIGVTGYRSTIIRELSHYDSIMRLEKDLPDTNFFVLAAGILRNKTFCEQRDQEVHETFEVNLFTPVRWCENILKERPHARICLMGSESGFKGSYDMTYAMSKSALHFYSTVKPLGSDQKLFTLAPHIIIDSGMTRRRHDYADIVKSRESYITAKEVAKMIWTGLNEGANEVIRIHRK